MDTLIIRNADPRSMITAIGATRASNNWILGLVIGTTVRIKDSRVSFRVEHLIAKEADRFWNGAFNVGLVDVKNG